jgi:hypothetical protein
MIFVSQLFHLPLYSKKRLSRLSLTLLSFITEILEGADDPGEPFPVRAAKRTYQACMDTGKSLLDIP